MQFDDYVIDSEQFFLRFFAPVRPSDCFNPSVNGLRFTQLQRRKMNFVAGGTSAVNADRYEIEGLEVKSTGPWVTSIC